MHLRRCQSVLCAINLLQLQIACMWLFAWMVHVFRSWLQNVCLFSNRAACGKFHRKFFRLMFWCFANLIVVSFQGFSLGFSSKPLRILFDWLKNAFCKLETLIDWNEKFCVGIKSVRFPLFFPNQPVCSCVAWWVVPVYHEMACYIFALLVFQLSKTIWHEMLERTLKLHRSFPRIRNSLKLPLETNNGRFSRIFRMPENRIRKLNQDIQCSFNLNGFFLQMKQFTKLSCAGISRISNEPLCSDIFEKVVVWYIRRIGKRSCYLKNMQINSVE